MLFLNFHVVVGLGETDQELVELFCRLQSEQIAAYLFSFNPEPGTVMEDAPRAPIKRLRRVQLVKHMIEQQGLRPEAIEFDDAGAIVGIDSPDPMVRAAIDSGVPFMTDGCPDRQGKVACNRPYGSYRPGDDFRDYPFEPRSGDIATIRQQIKIDEVQQRAASQ